MAFITCGTVRGMFYRCCFILFMVFVILKVERYINSTPNKTLDQSVKDVFCPSIVVFILIKSTGQH